MSATEVSPGQYFVHIDGENFQWNTTYQYSFSNESDGADLAPHLAWEFTTPVNPTAGDGGGGGGGGEEGGAGEKRRTALYVGIILLILILLAAFIMLSRKGMEVAEE